MAFANTITGRIVCEAITPGRAAANKPTEPDSDDGMEALNGLNLPMWGDGVAELERRTSCEKWCDGKAGPKT